LGSRYLSGDIAGANILADEFIKRFCAGSICRLAAAAFDPKKAHTVPSSTSQAIQIQS